MSRSLDKISADMIRKMPDDELEFLFRAVAVQILVRSQKTTSIITMRGDIKPEGEPSDVPATTVLFLIASGPACDHIGAFVDEHSHTASHEETGPERLDFRERS